MTGHFYNQSLPITFFALRERETSEYFVYGVRVAPRKMPLSKDRFLAQMEEWISPKGLRLDFANELMAQILMKLINFNGIASCKIDNVQSVKLS